MKSDWAAEKAKRLALHICTAPVSFPWENDITQALRDARRDALEEAAMECRAYAYSGKVSMMRRQVVYACEKRIRALISNEPNGDGGKQ